MSAGVDLHAEESEMWSCSWSEFVPRLIPRRVSSADELKALVLDESM
jgi:hypothetical protein